MNANRSILKLAIAGVRLCFTATVLLFCAGQATAQVDCAGVPNGTLEPVSFTSGGYVIESGAGLTDTESGTATIDIPSGVTIEEAWVYWSIRNTSEPDGEIDLVVNTSDYGTVEGDCIGLDTAIGGASSGPPHAFKYALDPGDLSAGATNSVDVEVVDDVIRADGFSVVVVYSMAGETGHSEFYEGTDFIWDEVPDVSSSLSFSGSILEQCEGNDLSLHLKVGDTRPDRPDRVTVEIGGSTFLEEYNFFGDAGEGWEPQWSDRKIIIGSGDYNAGETITVELASVEHPDDGGDPSSLVWVVGGVTCSVAVTNEVAGCTRTPGYWRNKGYRSGVLETALASAKSTFSDAFDVVSWDDLSVNEARAILNQNSCRDINDCLEKHLLASVLNVANGATNTIAATIDDAFEFLDSGMGDGEDLKDILDSFNNGLEGVPSCDSLEDEEAEVSPLRTGRFSHSVGPNPFNPTTMIHFSLSESMPVRLAVYDVLGREVRMLLDENVGAGEHQVHFDANGLTTGTYFYRFVTPEGAFGGQMILMK